MIAEQCFGGVPGDGINVVYELRVGDEIYISVEQGRDYSQPRLVFCISATEETIDSTIETLAKTAGEFRLKRV